jgi:hypothetical protein
MNENIEFLQAFLKNPAESRLDRAVFAGTRPENDRRNRPNENNGRSRTRRRHRRDYEIFAGSVPNENLISASRLTESGQIAERKFSRI